jgi:hypothetical protein
LWAATPKQTQFLAAGLNIRLLALSMSMTYQP